MYSELCWSSCKVNWNGGVRVPLAFIMWWETRIRCPFCFMWDVDYLRNCSLQNLLRLRVDLFLLKDSYKAIVPINGPEIVCRLLVGALMWEDQVLILIPGTVLSCRSSTEEKGWFFIILSILIAEESFWRCGIWEGIIYLKKVSIFNFFFHYIYECLDCKKYSLLF